MSDQHVVRITRLIMHDQLRHRDNARSGCLSDGRLEFKGPNVHQLADVDIRWLCYSLLDPS